MASSPSSPVLSCARRSSSDAPVAFRNTGSRSSLPISQASACNPKVSAASAENVTITAFLKRRKEFVNPCHKDFEAKFMQQSKGAPMPGTVLILDAIATNRIMQKVQLCAAYYRVVQSDSMEGLIPLVRRTRPDLILSAMRLPGGGARPPHAA